VPIIDTPREVKKEIKRKVLLSIMLLVNSHQNKDITNRQNDITTKIIKKMVPHASAPILNISRIFYFKF